MTNLFNIDDARKGALKPAAGAGLRAGAKAKVIASERRVVRAGTYSATGHQGVTVRSGRAGRGPHGDALAPAAGLVAGAGSGAAERKRVRAIDGYRGIGAVLVIVLHCLLAGRELFSTSAANGLHDLDICLPIFFVLSGMVAYMGIVRGAFLGKIRGTRELLVSRLWRVLPVYYAVVLIVWSMRFAGTSGDWHDLLLHLTFTQVWSGHMEFWLDGPSWFLADDMHFFLLIAIVGPLVARFAAGRRSNGQKLAVLTAFPVLLLTLGLIYVWSVSYGAHPATTQVLYSPLGKLDEFSEGMLLGLVLCLPGVVRERPWFANGLSAFGFGAIALLGYLRWHSGFVAIWDYEFVAIGVCCLMAAATMFGERQILSRILSARPLQFLAMIGFTIFLVQEPVMLQLEQWNLLYFQNRIAWWISTPSLVLVAALVAWLAYRLIEQPGYRVKALLSDLRARQRNGQRRRSGPAPRRLPDLVLERPDGGLTPIRELLGVRPLLIGLGPDGEQRLLEQQFRLDCGEADGLLIGAEVVRAQSGVRMLVDPAHRLRRALGVPVDLLEVAPDGLITALHMSDSDAWGAAVGDGADDLTHGEDADAAIAEHLLEHLDADEARVVGARFGRHVPVRLAAPALGIGVDELHALEASAREKAVELTVAFHEEMICEPAAMAQADGPDARVAAVLDHVRTCRVCRSEFDARVKLVLRHAGELVEPAAPLAIR